jgi:hypothetical protein
VHVRLVPVLQVLVQIIKQLRDNPTSSSLERGWCLLLLCLDSFPPSDAAENYIEHFLRSRSMLPCVLSLHRTLYVMHASSKRQHLPPPQPVRLWCGSSWGCVGGVWVSTLPAGVVFPTRRINAGVWCVCTLMQSSRRCITLLLPHPLPPPPHPMPYTHAPFPCRYRGALSFPPDAPALELALSDAMVRLEFVPVTGPASSESPDPATSAASSTALVSPGAANGAGGAGALVAPASFGGRPTRSGLPGNPEFYALSMSAVTDAFLAGALSPDVVLELDPSLRDA